MRDQQQNSNVEQEEPVQASRTTAGVNRVITGVRNPRYGIPGMVQTAPQQTPSVQTPYRSMSSPANYTADRLEQRIGVARFQSASEASKAVSQADRSERAIQNAQRQANAAVMDELGNPISLADRLEQDARSMVSRLTPDEIAAFGAEGIKEQNAAEQAAYETAETASSGYQGTGRPWVSAHLKKLADQKMARNNDPATPPSEVTSPFASDYARLSYLARAHGDLFAAVSQEISNGRMSMADLAAITNLSLAQRAAKEIAETPDPIRRSQILNVQGTPAQQALVLAILEKKAQVPDEVDVQSSNWAIGALQGVGNWLWETALPFVATGSESIIRGAMTAGNVMNNDVVGVDTARNGSLGQWDWEAWRAAWNQTAPGYFRPEDINYLQQKHGESQANLMLEAYQLRNSGEEDVVGELYERYADNVEALNIIDALFFSRDPSPELQDLVQETAYMDRGNYANWQIRGLVDMFGGDEYTETWKMPAYGWARDALNVTSWIALDPFIIGGKTARVIQQARFGLHHLAPGKIDNVFQKASVREYWDDLGGRLQNIKAMENGQQRRAALRSLSRQEKQWFPQDVIRSLYDAEVYSADDALIWFKEAGNVQRVMAGQPAKRARDKVVPHKGSVRMFVDKGLGTFNGEISSKKISAAIRATDPTNKIHVRFEQQWDDVIAQADALAGNRMGGRTWDELTDEEAAAVITEVGINPQAAEVMGKWMSSLTMNGDRTFAGKFWDAVKVGEVKQARQYGWKHEKSAENFLNFVSRTFAQLPDMRYGIRIDSAVDAQKVYQQARVAGFPRWWATELSELFAAADQGQRRLLLSGLARTQAYTMGAHLIDPESGVDNLVRLVTGYKPGEVYAANMVPGADRYLRKLLVQERAKAADVLRTNTEADEAADLVKLNAKFGEADVNDAIDLSAKKAAREDVRNTIAERQKELDDLNRQLEDAAGNPERWTPDMEREYQAMLDGMADPVQQLPGSEILTGFWLPNRGTREIAALRWKKTPGNGRRATFKDENGNTVVYTVSLTDEGFFAVKRGDELIATVDKIRSAQGFAARDAAENYGKIARTADRGVRDLDKLAQGYLPKQWADDLANGRQPESVWPEEQARLFEDPTSPDAPNLDFKALAEQAKGGWIEIPWVRNLRMQARNNVEGLESQGIEVIERELAELGDELIALDDEIAFYAQAGARDLDSLKDELYTKPVKSEEEILEAVQGQFDTWLRQQMGESPSEMNGSQNAVFMPQTSNIVAFPAFNQLEPLLARNTYLGTLLGRNVGGNALTDLWVFMTLAGPRFSVRNAFEDWIFWGLSAGTMVGDGSLTQGRHVSQGMRQARQIESKKLNAARKARDEKAEELETGQHLPHEARALEEQLKALDAEVTKLEKRGKGKVRTEKLGFIKTLMRKGGTKLAKLDNTTDPLESRFRAIVHPYLSDDEIVAANAAYRDGNRTELAQLIAKAATRERIFFLPDGDGTVARLKAWVRARNGDTSVLSPEDQRVLTEIEQFAMGRNGFENVNGVSEEARNFMDGNLPSWQDSPDFVYAGGKPLQRVFVDGGWKSVESARPNKRSVDATWQTLAMALHGDGPKAQAAMRLLPEWMVADEAKRSELVDLIAAEIVNADAEVGYLGRFSLINAEGEINEAAVRNLARSTLLTLEGAFTGRDGRFNEKLWMALKRDDMGDGNLTNFKLWDDGELKVGQGTQAELVTPVLPEAGVRSYRVNKMEFTDGTYSLPRTYLTFDGDSMLVPANGLDTVSKRFGSGWANFTAPAWEMMGRSLARMTREPMYFSNYLEARKMLRPFEAEWKRLYGEDWWKIADDVANEQAYNLTLAYVDNPAMRSQLAWQVRNVARFYRATEDFYRRTYRLVKNYPVTSMAKLALAINVVRNVGFVQWDENGEAYFVYPGTPGMFEAVNMAQQVLRLDFGLSSGGLPLEMTGRLTGLTPSADPNALVPTMSGWFASVPLRGLLRTAPSLDKFTSPLLGEGRIGDLAYGIESTLMGEITADSRDIGRDWMPTHLKRLVAIWESVAANDDALQSMTTGAVADAARLSIVANVRAGRIAPDQEITNDNRDEILARLDATATDILILKFLAGAFLPASPTIKPADVSDIAREYGMYSLKQEFYQMRERFGDDEAIMLWIERHPDEAPYTVSSAGGSEYDGFWQATEQTDEWIRANRTLVDKYPLGSSIIAPPQDQAIFNPKVYTFLQRQGLVNKGTVGDFLHKQTNVRSWLEYQSLTAQYDMGRDYVYQNISDPEARKAALAELDDRLANGRNVLYDRDPALEERVRSGKWGMSSQATVSEISKAVTAALPNAEGAQAQRLGDMRTVLDMYEEAAYRMSTINNPMDPAAQDLKDAMRERWKPFVLDWYEKYRTDSGFVSTLRATSEALGFQIRELR